MVSFMAKIGRPKLMAERVQVSLTPELAAAVDEFRFGNRIGSESEAIRRLLERGLEAEKKAP